MMRLRNGVAKRSAAHCLRRGGVQQRQEAVKGLRPCFSRCAPYAPMGDCFPPLLRRGFHEGNGLLDLCLGAGPLRLAEDPSFALNARIDGWGRPTLRTSTRWS